MAFNKFEKIQRDAGFRNPNDIFDQPSISEIRAEIENILPNVREFIDETSHNLERYKILNRLRNFCKSISDDFKSEFLKLLEGYGDKNKVLSKSIVEFIKNKDMVSPSFTITHGVQAEVLLEEFGLSPEINENELLLVFQLPKQLAKFWNKGGVDDWGNLAKNVGGTVVEWGYFYRKLMPIIWMSQGQYENEAGLNFSRVNEIAQHDPGKYYYVWRISGWSNFSEPLEDEHDFYNDEQGRDEYGNSYERETEED